ncbi:flap endonuclease GEN homolog 1-like [Centruroides sculpturatus]|uniref:flap endonuclease GEN homolog 1-like n=1 Tax=Centruroides sculpturatus TaxID=218467 RepID=UPI000C6D1596|nr:flap endonuclease GEN homolog 1-like [Centruroides sculpturatus]
MGVNHLWDILAPVGQRVPLEELQDQTVAVDLSGWILESNRQKELAANIKKPHIRNLFFRISCMLHLGIKPIFVLEGIAPNVKKDTLSQRQKSNDRTSSSLCSRKHFTSILRECRELIENLGLVCIQSCGEAEATCAFLNSKKLVSGCVTDDSDAFLYGARTVYRDFSTTPTDPHVIAYSMDDIENKLNLDRRKLVALAVILGCDYHQTGIPGIGKEKAMKLLEKLKDVDILDRFHQWKNGDVFASIDTSLLTKKSLTHCNKCNHPGTNRKHSTSGCQLCKTKVCCLDNKVLPCPCEWHRAHEMDLEFNVSRKALEDPNFPHRNITEEYLGFADSFDSIPLQWNRPSLTSLQNFMSSKLGWTVEAIREKVVPLITLWQITTPEDAEFVDSNIFKPVRIVKECKRKFQRCVIVEWEWINKSAEYANETTTEPRELFERKYPKLMIDYETECNKKAKEKNKSKRKQVNNDPKQWEVRCDKNLIDLRKDLELKSEGSRRGLKEIDINALQNTKEISATKTNKDSNTFKAHTEVEWSRYKHKSKRELIDCILDDDDDDDDDSLSDESVELSREHSEPYHGNNSKALQVDNSIIVIDSPNKSCQVIIIDSDDESSEEIEKKVSSHKRSKDKENMLDFSPLPLRDRLKILKL